MPKNLDQRGWEIPDPTPLEVPLHWKRPPTLQDTIRQFIRTELSNQAVDQGAESFEEADDFDMDEEPDPLSAYEMREMQEESPIRRREAPKEESPAKAPDKPGGSPPAKQDSPQGDLIPNEPAPKNG